MIYINKGGISEKDFLDILEKTKKLLEEFFRRLDSKDVVNGVEFETVVCGKMKEASNGTSFDGYIERTGTYAFPDIIAKKLFGVEVKMTTGDKWVSTGNSVLETTRVEGIERIYMLFGKFGTEFAVKYRPYQECLNDVGVTHSPRYKIDMELAKGESIFDKMGTNYDLFRKNPDSIKLLKDYYRKQLKDGEELWWIDSVSNTSVSPIIKPFRSLETEVQERFIAEVFVLFPEVFGTTNLKFERPAAYLIIEYNAVSSSLRDIFSAGGREDVKIKGKATNLSRITHNFFIRAKEIEKVLHQTSKETLAYYWGLKRVDNPIDAWKVALSKYSQIGDNEKVDLLKVFEEGLSHEV